MSVVRRNILSHNPSRDGFISGVKLLKQEDSGKTTTDFGIPGPVKPVSTYDLFVVWHYAAMNQSTPPGNPFGRNAAHRGPVFAPWHRVMLLLLEQNLQRVLGDASFGLPYWDWAADGDKPVGQQPSATIWSASYLGGSGRPVSTGPFKFDPADPQTWRVLIATNQSGQLRSTNRGLERRLAAPPPAGVTTLPTTTEVSANLSMAPPYDQSPWSAGASQSTFRNRLEGWNAGVGSSGPQLHNRVHVCIGGDMGPASSPNDPAFYLNHCNVDRLWEAWMVRPSHGRVYAPPQSASAELAGHRIDDPILAPFPGSSLTPRNVLNMATFYSYDVLP